MVGWLLAVVACSWPGERVQQMEEHETDLYRARDAVLNGDLAAVRAAARDLARPDRVPGLLPLTENSLTAMRRMAVQLRAAESIEASIPLVVGMTAHCAQCHDALGLDAVTPLPDTPENRLWIGLVFVDEASWDAGAEGRSALEAAKTWTARRAATVDWMTASRR